MHIEKTIHQQVKLIVSDYANEATGDVDIMLQTADGNEIWGTTLTGCVGESEAVKLAYSGAIQHLELLLRVLRVQSGEDKLVQRQ